MKLFRPIVAVAGAFSLVLTMSACGTGAATSNDSSGNSAKEITVVIAEYSKDHTAKFWNAFKTEYEKTTPYKMNLQIISWDDMDQKSSTMVQTGNLPDILNENAYAQYAAEGLLFSADEVLSTETKADIIPAFVASGTYDGKFYGMPDLSSARALFYNTDLFAQAGIEKPPTTWDEFVADAQKVKALGNGVVGYAQPLGAFEAQAEFAIWMFNNGGDFKKDGEWTLNSPQNIETLNFMKDLSVKYGVTNENPGHFNRDDGAFSLFEQGKAGMVVGFGPLSTALDAQFPNLKYGIAPMPTNDGQSPRTYGVTDYVMSFKKKGNQDAVKAFYKLYYQPEQVNTWIKSEGFLPVTTSGIKAFASDEKLKVYLDTLPDIHLAPNSDPEYNKVQLTIKSNIGLVVASDGNPKKFLDDLQAQAEAGK